MIFINKKLIKGGSFLLFWGFLSFFYDSLILPSPIEVFLALKSIVFSSDFLLIVSNTLLKLIIGLILALAVGITLGLSISLNNALKDIFYPVIVFLQAAPVISFILLALIWFSPSIIPVFILCINTFPNLTINVYEGINNIDNKLLEMSRFYRVDNKTLIKKLYIPSIISHILASTRIILSNAFKITVMAEVISKSNMGIGSKINWAWINIETDTILAWTLIIVFLSFFIEKKSVAFLEKKWGKYYG
jgi:NitT/TauT family transport system permease protein